MKAVLVGLLKGYKRWVSPMLPVACRYVPSCSEYAMEAIAVHGVMRGSWMAMGRLLRCHPFVSGGYDPVPHQHCEHKIPEATASRASNASSFGYERAIPARSSLRMTSERTVETLGRNS